MGSLKDREKVWLEWASNPRPSELITVALPSDPQDQHTCFTAYRQLTKCHMRDVGRVELVIKRSNSFKGKLQCLFLRSSNYQCYTANVLYVLLVFSPVLWQNVGCLWANQTERTRIADVRVRVLFRLEIFRNFLRPAKAALFTSRITLTQNFFNLKFKFMNFLYSSTSERTMYAVGNNT